MKKTNFIFVLLLLTILSISCSSNSEDVPCTPTPCLNGGVSNADCGCDCPQGFTGSDCSTQLIPTKIFITKIKVTKFPNLKTNQNQWDSFVLAGYERPDIFPSLSFYNGNYLYAGQPINDSFSYGNDNFTFIPSTPIEINQVSSQYTISLWDDDTIGTSINQEFIGGYNFYIYANNGFPAVLNISTSNGLVAFELYLTYQW